MAQYVYLVKLTEQGRKAIKQSPDRADQAVQLGQKMNVRLGILLYTMGEYDIVALAEAPDDEAATRFAAAVSAQGNVATQTLRAFTPQEFRTITADL